MYYRTDMAAELHELRVKEYSKVTREEDTLSMKDESVLLFAPAVKAALQIYLRTNNTGFAPSVSQVIGCIYALKDNEELTEGEAWALVKKGNIR